MTTSPPEGRPSGAGRRGGILFALAYFTGMAVLVALIFQLAPSTVETVETTTTLPPSTTTTSVPSTVPTFGPVGGEPVADAAEVILPSVVFIQTPSGFGSGVVYRSDGYIITAAHVVGQNESVLVRFGDGSQSRGEVIGAVSEVDIAVLKVDRDGLVAARFSSAKPRVGQMAVAVGSPWGLAQTVTAGIISAVDQTTCTGDICAAMVQTDAAINPGNSGGALIDRTGVVVGINVSILTQSGANDGVGFAVPSAMAVAYADAIIAGEALETAFLGVRIANSTGERAGAVITEIFADSGADNADLEVDDLVVAVAGIPILNGADLQAQIRTHRPGSTIDLLVVRNGTEVVVTVTLGVRAEDL